MSFTQVPQLFFLLPNINHAKNDFFPNLEVQPSKFVGWSVEREIEEEWVV